MEMHAGVSGFPEGRSSSVSSVSAPPHSTIITSLVVRPFPGPVWALVRLSEGGGSEMVMEFQGKVTHSFPPLPMSKLPVGYGRRESKLTSPHLLPRTPPGDQVQTEDPVQKSSNNLI